jgi:hypothetical protein
MERLLLLLLTALVLSPAVLMNRPTLQAAGPAQNQLPLNLNGKWTTSDGEDVIVVHRGQSVRATFIAGAVCPYGGTRSYYISGQLRGNTLSGDMMRCTRISNLVNKCNVNSLYTTSFKSQVSPASISGEWRYEWFDSKEEDASGCQYQRNSSKDGENHFSLTRACDNANLCATLNSAYQSVSRAVDTLNSGGRPPTSFADFKANLSRQLDTVQEELERCDNPSGKIGEVKNILDTSFANPRDQLESVQRALNSARVDFMQSGGPCYGMPSPTGDSSGGNPSANEDPTDESPSGEEGPEQEGPCKEGEKPKTAQDNAAISQLIRALGQDTNRLEQQARVLRGSRQLAAVRAKIEKLKQMRAFWQQVAAVPCLPPEIPESVRRYLQERQAQADTADECTQLCSATSAWVEQQTNSNLQMNFSMNGCLASCNR